MEKRKLSFFLSFFPSFLPFLSFSWLISQLKSVWTKEEGERCLFIVLKIWKKKRRVGV